MKTKLQDLDSKLWNVNLFFSGLGTLVESKCVLQRFNFGSDCVFWLIFLVFMKNINQLEIRRCHNSRLINTVHWNLEFLKKPQIKVD